jgi:hypothetical protein
LEHDEIRIVEMAGEPRGRDDERVAVRRALRGGDEGNAG